MAIAASAVAIDLRTTRVSCAGPCADALAEDDKSETNGNNIMSFPAKPIRLSLT